MFIDLQQKNSKCSKRHRCTRTSCHIRGEPDGHGSLQTAQSQTQLQWRLPRKPCRDRLLYEVTPKPAQSQCYK